MKTKTILGALTIVAVTATLAVPVVAQSRGEGMRGGMHGAMLDFETLDINKDGKITKEDITAARDARIKSMDPDGDGFVTREEMLAHAMEAERKRVEARVGDMFDSMDTDADGRLSAAEVISGRMGRSGSGGMDRMFDRVDADKDGAISPEELDAAKVRMTEMREGRGGRGDRDGHGAREGRRGHDKMHGKMHGEQGASGQDGRGQGGPGAGQKPISGN
ncbi:MAG: hypothetical protein Q7J57_07540 [Gemmobacter sp.]|nr:hypothetical protein [Gemmobacter sp.]